MKNKKNKLRDFYILWSTQSLSQLGSSMTAFALTLWLYQKTGSALSTAALTICTYVPYVLMSIFAGALTDRFDKKRTMLVCDTIAACCTILVLVLYKTDSLVIWHLYAINVFSGLMNTVQQPASEVAMTLIVDKDDYQKTSGLKSLSRSLVTILNPLLATALYGLVGLDGVIYVDIASFLVAFVALAGFIKLPDVAKDASENVLKLAKEGITFLKSTPMILILLFFMSGVNFCASSFDAVLPALVIPSPKGGAAVLGIVSSASGIAMVVGSVIASIVPKPKDRIKVVYWTMIASFALENFLLAFSRLPVVWCIGQFLGWVLVPIMSTNLDVILRNSIPLELQGRVYACRNTLQFFTIPIGLFWGGWMVDHVCEPFMATNTNNNVLTTLFGIGKGSGAALMIFIVGVLAIVLCLVIGSRLKRYSYIED